MTQLYFGGDDDSLIVGDDYDPMADLFSGDGYEIMGEDDEPDDGFGDLEIFGAARRSRGRSRMSRVQQLALARAAGGKVVGERAPRREYRQVLPCTQTGILSGATQVIQLNPQRPFRPEAFRASSTHTSPYFVITAYAIGQDNQFVGPGSIPVDLFSEVAFDSKVVGYTANLGSLITLTVQNIDAATRDFRAAFFGTALGN